MERASGNWTAKKVLELAEVRPPGRARPAGAGLGAVACRVSARAAYGQQWGEGRC
jgi:hypothetical protein